METIPLHTTTIYIMKLEGGYWYVGKTHDIAKRVKQHFEQNGSTWTKLHKPIAMEACYRNASPFDEDKYTKEYMMKYGIDKVRGGAYSAPRISNEQKELIQRELWGAQDLCFLCGNNHYVKDCSLCKNRKTAEETESLTGSDNSADTPPNRNRQARACIQRVFMFLYDSIKLFFESVPETHSQPRSG